MKECVASYGRLRTEREELCVLHWPISATYRSITYVLSDSLQDVGLLLLTSLAIIEPSSRTGRCGKARHRAVHLLLVDPGPVLASAGSAAQPAGVIMFGSGDPPTKG